ncbi:hypothetical protein GUITHDRAFT_112701 [Guillardia theta CCMP2712]|uniref:Uncharacterized protein n=1 Tax=Guillardia theta (strain CCMP2712) TaxID=905079 RepID=L1IZH4_GUITC|nr:hypothetical protein GUITHDRAFT_112701 [Guillardia theta CCMP2712]EKX41230.1 hypothetical protein GUITHDRAFT_112701 [Guillardia theta CCMP2712]|eukprot:XP_005828210.1 hypothetical protein GUITHDRAFT_112701 [Guillardia theta CCMP2712]
MAASNVKVGAVMERRSMLGFHTSQAQCIGSNSGRAICCRQKLGGGRINVIAGRKSRKSVLVCQDRQTSWGQDTKEKDIQEGDLVRVREDAAKIMAGKGWNDIVMSKTLGEHGVVKLVRHAPSVDIAMVEFERIPGSQELKDNMAAIQEHMQKKRIEQIEQRLAQFDKQKETKNPTVEKSHTSDRKEKEKKNEKEEEKEEEEEEDILDEIKRNGYGPIKLENLSPGMKAWYHGRRFSYPRFFKKTPKPYLERLEKTVEEYEAKMRKETKNEGSGVADVKNNLSQDNHAFMSTIKGEKKDEVGSKKTNELKQPEMPRGEENSQGCTLYV